MSEIFGTCRIDPNGKINCKKETPTPTPAGFEPRNPRPKALPTPLPPSPVAKNCVVDSTGKCIDPLTRPTIVKFAHEGSVDWVGYAGALEAYTQKLEGKVAALSTH